MDWETGWRFFFSSGRMSLMFIFVESYFWRDYRVRVRWESWWD